MQRGMHAAAGARATLSRSHHTHPNDARTPRSKHAHANAASQQQASPSSSQHTAPAVAARAHTHRPRTRIVRAHARPPAPTRAHQQRPCVCTVASSATAAAKTTTSAQCFVARPSPRRPSDTDKHSDACAQQAAQQQQDGAAISGAAATAEPACRQARVCWQKSAAAAADGWHRARWLPHLTQPHLHAAHNKTAACRGSRNTPSAHDAPPQPRRQHTAAPTAAASEGRALPAALVAPRTQRPPLNSVVAAAPAVGTAPHRPRWCCCLFFSSPTHAGHSQQQGTHTLATAALVQGPRQQRTHV